jgi:outer membrane lipoprotein-sorting protein
MMKNVVAVTLVSIITLSAFACQGEELPSGEEIIDGAIAALEDLEIYQFDAEMNMEMTVETEGETGRFTASADYSGATDIADSESMINLDINVTGTGELGEDMEMSVGAEMYLIDSTVYAKIDMPFFMDEGWGSGWIKFEIPEDLIEQPTPANQLDYLTEILELAEFKVTGTQKMNSVACYVLEMTPDMDKLMDLIAQQVQLATGEEPEDMELEQLRNMLNNIANDMSLKLWIAKDTYFLTRMELNASLDMTPEDLGEPEEEGRLITNISMIFDIHEINQPVSIELPPEAEGATEMPLDDMPW